jgi:phosphatidylglycerophosphatase A
VLDDLRKQALKTQVVKALLDSAVGNNFTSQALQLVQQSCDLGLIVLVETVGKACAESKDGSFIVVDVKRPERVGGVSVEFAEFHWFDTSKGSTFPHVVQVT